MYLDGVAVCACRILNFRDGDFATRPRQLQYLTRQCGQRRAKDLLVFYLCCKVVFLLSHRFEKEHQPGLPALFLIANRLLGAPECKVIAFLICLDDGFHRTVRYVAVTGAQQEERREYAREPAIAVLERVDRKEHDDENPDQYQGMLALFLYGLIEPLDE